MIAAWNRVAPKARYLATAAIRTVTGATPSCPSCGNDSSSFVARKYVVTQLRRCTGCHLLFRTPTWRPDTSEAFYERSYTQGFTTDLPDDVALASLLTSKFHHSEKDYRPYLGVPTPPGSRRAVVCSTLVARGGTGPGSCAIGA
jgi:hypothetical protein